MALPFDPEPLVDMQERFPRALLKVWTAKPFLQDTPGQHREHVFDFEDGMRLIVSRDILVRPEPQLHVSASWGRPFLKPQNWRELVPAVFKTLSQSDAELEFVGFSPVGIPHFVVKEGR